MKDRTCDVPLTKKELEKLRRTFDSVKKTMRKHIEWAKTVPIEERTDLVNGFLNLPPLSSDPLELFETDESSKDKKKNRRLGSRTRKA